MIFTKEELVQIDWLLERGRTLDQAQRMMLEGRKEAADSVELARVLEVNQTIEQERYVSAYAEYGYYTGGAGILTARIQSTGHGSGSVLMECLRQNRPLKILPA